MFAFAIEFNALLKECYHTEGGHTPPWKYEKIDDVIHVSNCGVLELDVHVANWLTTCVSREKAEKKPLNPF